MVNVEFALGRSLVVAVVVNVGVPHDKRPDGDVERFVARGVFRRERVEHKLEVWLGLGRSLIEREARTEELC